MTLPVQTCLHRSTADHADNPPRFRCRDCGLSFTDYGFGYEPTPSTPSPSRSVEPVADTQTEKWNADKPHRCPACHASTVTIEQPRERVLYTCCRCGTRFSSDPGNENEVAEIMCAEHREAGVYEAVITATDDGHRDLIPDPQP